MRLTNMAKGLIAATIWSLIASPDLACADRPLAGLTPLNPAVVSDVALDEDNRIHGIVADPEGRPLAGAQVLILPDRADSLTTATDAQGSFVVMVSHGGVYRIEVAAGEGIFRVWTAGTAPPRSQTEVSIVSGALTVRGQSGSAYCWISEHPWQFYTMAAIAIAVPIAVVSHNRRSGS